MGKLRVGGKHEQERVMRCGKDIQSRLSKQ